MYRVTKRDGSITEFHIAKIGNAITRAFEAVGRQQHPSVIELLALRVTAEFEPKIRNGLISVEDIQDCVERVLSEAGYSDVAKAYILYRKQREKLRNVGSTLLNYKELVNNYLRINDWRVKENSTVTYSVGGLILSNSGAITANYWLSEIYDAEIAQAHRNAELHLHDLSMLTGYCAGWSLRQLIQEGLGGVPGKISSSPASHLSTLCNQMVNFLGIMQNEWAGAQAFSSFDTYLAPFVRVDKLTQREVKQCVQSFVYGVNTPSRWGTQAPFSNITLDWTVPKDMANLPAIVGGQEQPFTYGECQKEMDMVNKAFIELMIEGDANGRGFQYPIPTYSITKDFDWGDTENNKLLFEMTAKYGTPYFSNYINSDMEPNDVRSMCCRLRLDLRELRKKSGGFFGSGESTGSVGVVTINLPRIAYLAEGEADFYRRLDKLMDIAARSLKTKRMVITKLMEGGLYPYTRRYLGTFENHRGVSRFGSEVSWRMEQSARAWCPIRHDLSPSDLPKAPYQKPVVTKFGCAGRLSEGGLPHAGDLALVGQFPEADTADAVVTQISVRTAADLAAVIVTGGELGFFLLLENHCFSCHYRYPPIKRRTERQPWSATLWLLRRWSRWCRCRCPCRGSYRPCRTRFPGRSAVP